jgi:hypothetical protein
MNEMKGSSVGTRANRVVEVLTSLIVLLPSQFEVAGFPPLIAYMQQLTSVCTERENAEVRIPYKQYILYYFYGSTALSCALAPFQFLDSIHNR